MITIKEMEIYAEPEPGTRSCETCKYETYDSSHMYPCYFCTRFCFWEEKLNAKYERSVVKNGR